jgi:hypothetical protein
VDNPCKLPENIPKSMGHIMVTSRVYTTTTNGWNDVSKFDNDTAMWKDIKSCSIQSTGANYGSVYDDYAVDWSKMDATEDYGNMGEGVFADRNIMR